MLEEYYLNKRYRQDYVESLRVVMSTTLFATNPFWLNGEIVSKRKNSIEVKVVMHQMADEQTRRFSTNTDLLLRDLVRRAIGVEKQKEDGQKVSRKTIHPSATVQ